jgi:hypothetical protein
MFTIFLLFLAGVFALLGATTARLIEDAIHQRLDMLSPRVCSAAATLFMSLSILCAYAAGAH